MTAKSISEPMALDGVTPMMAQYLTIKSAHEDYLVFYRMGDFYELFFQDAVTAASALDITLTHRGKHLGADIPMCGVPFHASEAYLHRLIRQGFKVAVCEQTEDPAEAKKRGSKSVVRREVVRLVTPGTLSEEGLLEARAHNFLSAIAAIGGASALAWLDMSTGEFWVSDVHPDDLPGTLARLAPSELLMIDDARDEALSSIHQVVQDVSPMTTITGRALAESLSDMAPSLIAQCFEEKLDTTPLSRPMLGAIALLLDYLVTTQITSIPRLSVPQIFNSHAYMDIDAATRQNLELARTQSGSFKGSLLSTIDRTLSAAGARVLSHWLSAPLLKRAEIEARHNGVAFHLDQTNATHDIMNALKTVPDVSRALSRLALDRGGPRDLLNIGRAIQAGQYIRRVLAPLELPQIHHYWAVEIESQLNALQDIVCRAVEEQPPLITRDGNFIRSGFDPALDEVRALRDESRRIIAALQARYIEQTGVKALKIKYNSVLGYHIDVPAGQGDKLVAPPFNETFIHRQTLASSVRFSTTELATLAGEISRAGETALQRELTLFSELREQVLIVAPRLEALAGALAGLDAIVSLAVLAREQDWTRPQLHDDMRFDIEGGRHPVVEAALDKTRARFVANNCSLTDPEKDAARLLLLTGPNMAGKSTFLRQNALIAILAQMGSYVPAKSAHIGLVDRVFSRVGAADDLARGRSTFMVEMVETAAILKNATPRSLVILDEIGRGTATFDGLSLAWSCVEYLHEVTGCRTLFATHYHELTALTERMSRMFNMTMRVREHAGELVFLHEVALGAADRSYGIHVAELAGLPTSVTERAKVILETLEESRSASPLAPTLDGLPLFEVGVVRQPETDALRDALTDIDPDRLSPRDALDWLYRLRKML